MEKRAADVNREAAVLFYSGKPDPIQTRVLILSATLLLTLTFIRKLLRLWAGHRLRRELKNPILNWMRATRRFRRGVVLAKAACDCLWVHREFAMRDCLRSMQRRHQLEHGGTHFSPDTSSNPTLHPKHSEPDPVPYPRLNSVRDLAFYDPHTTLFRTASIFFTSSLT